MHSIHKIQLQWNAQAKPEKYCSLTAPNQGRVSYSGSAFLKTWSAVYTRLFVAVENSLETKLGWGAAFLKYRSNSTLSFTTAILLDVSKVALV